MCRLALCTLCSTRGFNQDTKKYKYLFKDSSFAEGLDHTQNIPDDIFLFFLNSLFKTAYVLHIVSLLTDNLITNSSSVMQQFEFNTMSDVLDCVMDLDSRLCIDSERWCHSFTQSLHCPRWKPTFGPFDTLEHYSQLTFFCRLWDTDTSHMTAVLSDPKLCNYSIIVLSA